MFIGLLGGVLLSACQTEGDPFCGGEPMTGGHDVPAAFPIDMASNAGTFTFRYETRNAKDRVRVSYEGAELFDSGCVGESRSVELTYGPGRTQHVDVSIDTNCESGALTSWLFAVGCPTGAADTPSVKSTISDNQYVPRR